MMDNQAINKWVFRSKSGDKAAFESLVRHFHPRIYTYAFRLLCNEEDAKDVTQDTFLKIWSQLSAFDSSFQFSTWMYKITTNLCLDRLTSYENSHKMRGELEEYQHETEYANGETHLMNQELAEKIRALTSQLPPKQKTVFTLRYLAEWDVKEIATITGMSAEKVKSNLYIARQTVSQKLKLLRK